MPSTSRVKMFDWPAVVVGDFANGYLTGFVITKLNPKIHPTGIIEDATEKPTFTVPKNLTPATFRDRHGRYRWQASSKALTASDRVLTSDLLEAETFYRVKLVQTRDQRLEALEQAQSGNDSELVALNAQRATIKAQIEQEIRDKTDFKSEEEVKELLGI